MYFEPPVLLITGRRWPIDRWQARARAEESTLEKFEVA